MTPEERARQIIADMQIFAERDELARLIAAAIREAVCAEREACANVALEVARQFGDRMEEIGWENASLFNTLARQVAACERVANHIRKREDD